MWAIGQCRLLFGHLPEWTEEYKENIVVVLTDILTDIISWTARTHSKMQYLSHIALT